MLIPERAIPHCLLHSTEAETALLIRKNYRLLGTGAYSQVWAIPGCKTRVLKVGMRNDTWPEYIHYANWLGELGKKAPLVYSINQKRHHYFAVMERLYPACAGHRNLNTEDWLAFREKLTKVRADFDVGNSSHSQNLMERTNGELVLTDPWYGGDEMREPFRFHNGQTHCLPEPEPHKYLTGDWEPRV